MAIKGKTYWPECKTNVWKRARFSLNLGEKKEKKIWVEMHKAREKKIGQTRKWIGVVGLARREIEGGKPID